MLCASYYQLFVFIYLCSLFIRALCSLLLFIYFVRCSTLLFVLLFDFILHRFFCFYYSLCIVFKSKVHSDTGLCSGILIPLFQYTTSSIRINKHHTADSTDFVLVQERRTYCDHRHSGINETNILQVDTAVEGETRTAS